MCSTTAFLMQLQRTWRQEPRPQRTVGRFYLTPEQRMIIVRELLYPVADQQNR